MFSVGSGQNGDVQRVSQLKILKYPEVKTSNQSKECESQMDDEQMNPSVSSEMQKNARFSVLRTTKQLLILHGKNPNKNENVRLDQLPLCVIGWWLNILTG